MNDQIEKADNSDESADESTVGYDYARVDAIARIALYDDLRSAPRVTEIMPAPTGEFIESLASKVYEQARSSGGTIPYTVIREVSENFIHARFTEVTVSILDNGNTIRFADQGPGIPQKEKAQLPGFTSAIEPMKHYIRGVGSGLPIVKEYLDFSHGTISIEDNLGTGSVVTISLSPQEDEEGPYGAFPHAFDQPQAERAYQAERPYQAPAVQPQPYQQPYQPQQAMQQQVRQDYLQPQMGQGYPYSGAPGLQQGGYQQAAPLPAAYPGGYQQPAYPQQTQHHLAAPLVPPLTKRESEFLPLFLSEGALGVTDLVNITGTPQSSTYFTLTKLEQAGLIEKTAGQKRILTELGYQVAVSL